MARLYEVTRGQPGLVSWFGELLTEKYNPSAPEPLTMRAWDYAYGAACQVEPNNTVLNLLKKARREPYRQQVVDLFSRGDVPFAFDKDWCNYLYLNGVIDYEETTLQDGRVVRVCRFASPFIQLRLYNAFTGDLDDLGGRVPAVDLWDDLTEVFTRLDLPALLGRYQDYLKRLKAKGINPWQGQPRRADLHLTEAVGHFHLYWWLVEATRQHLVITPEFPTGNGKVDLHVRNRERAGVIEVKSFTQRSDLPSQKAQAARYAHTRDLAAATLAMFVPTDDEDLLKELSGQEVIEGVVVTIVAIGAV